MKIAMLQFAPVFGELESNLETIRQALDGLTADLIILPELCTTGYQFVDREELARLAEAPDGPSLEQMSALARNCQGNIVYGFAESSNGKLFNSAALVGKKGVLALYRKVHLFADEKRLFDPGDLGFVVHKTAGASIGIMICFDWIFPESARTLTLKGAQLIAHPANLVLPYCQDAIVTRALENRVFCATCNRTGEEERIEGKPLRFTGKSRLVAPDGRVLADGEGDRQELLMVEIDPRQAANKKVTPENDLLADRRPELYER